MPRYRYKGNVPRPVKCADGEVRSITPGMEFEASSAAVSDLKRQGLVMEYPELKVVKKASPKKLSNLPLKVEKESEKKPEEKSEKVDEKVDEKTLPGFKRKGK